MGLLEPPALTLWIFRARVPTGSRFGRFFRPGIGADAISLEEGHEQGRNIG